MAIVAGRKQQSQAVGIVADYCAICREVRPFVIHQFQTVSHIYWIPIGAARPVACVGQCTQCGITSIVDPSAYTRLAGAFQGDIRSLITETNPALKAYVPVRKQLEASASRREISEAQRRELLLEPFQLLAPAVEDLYLRDRNAARKIKASDVAILFSPVHVLDNTPTGTASTGASLFLLGAVFAPIAGILTVPAFPQNLVWLPLAIGVVLMVLCIVGVNRAQKRYRRRVIEKRVLPLLGHSLRALQPSVDEIRAALEVFASKGQRIGSSLRAEDVAKAMESQE